MSCLISCSRHCSTWPWVAPAMTGKAKGIRDEASGQSQSCGLPLLLSTFFPLASAPCIIPAFHRWIPDHRISRKSWGPGDDHQSPMSHCCVDDSEPSIPRPARHSQVIWLGKQYSSYPYRILAHLGSSLGIAIHDVLVLMVCFLLLTRNWQCCDCFSLFIGVLT